MRCDALPGCAHGKTCRAEKDCVGLALFHLHYCTSVSHFSSLFSLQSFFSNFLFIMSGPVNHALAALGVPLTGVEATSRALYEDAAGDGANNLVDIGIGQQVLSMSAVY